jgi:hypothetical protein
MEEARTAPYQAIHRMEGTASLDAECVRAMEEAMHEAAKYETRCEALAALVEFARTMIEQARVAEAEQAREAAAATATAAAERLRVGEEMSALRLWVQEMRVRLGVWCRRHPPRRRRPRRRSAWCASKRYAMVPCMHKCACEECAQQLLLTVTRSRPVCCEPIQRTTRVFF